MIVKIEQRKREIVGNSERKERDDREKIVKIDGDRFRHVFYRKITANELLLEEKLLFSKCLSFWS